MANRCRIDIHFKTKIDEKILLSLFEKELDFEIHEMSPGLVVQFSEQNVPTDEKYTSLAAKCGQSFKAYFEDFTMSLAGFYDFDGKTLTKNYVVPGAACAFWMGDNKESERFEDFVERSETLLVG